ncbi:MAG TPA: hypothetical protein VJ796_03095 [Acidimicrobiia bacterium]|nr:hypothetical protein [Acidimicrobiia bacterium]
MPPPSLEDPRSTSQRRADALEDLARSFLNLCLLCRYHHSLTHLEIDPEEEARALSGSGTARSP